MARKGRRSAAPLDAPTNREVYAVVAWLALGRRRPRAMVTAVPASASSPAAGAPSPPGAAASTRLVSDAC